MTSPELHPVERSLYPYIVGYLHDIGIESVSELKKASNYVDILFEIGRSRFILEIKIERKNEINPIVDGIVQAYQYGLENNTKNLIVICYPEHVSEQIATLDEVKDKALKTKVESVILTEFWHDYNRHYNIEDVLSTLKFKVEQNIRAQLNVSSTAEIIQKCVTSISRLINKYYRDEERLNETMNYLTQDYGLFIELSQSKTSQKRNQVVDLLAYLLVNQILFYFLYAKKSQELKPADRVDEIKKINYLGELDTYFDQIRKIDYKPIFDILVVPRIPSPAEVIGEVNKLIECLTPLQISEMKQDLYGRLIGNSLPKETRKILASYYTKSQSADLLTNLTIDNHTDTVWDLACGSGTLLVSSYDRKLKLFKIQKRTLDSGDEDMLHARFIEQDLTGTDVMPFACHLTGLNLSAKNLKHHTNSMRIAIKNSLSIPTLTSPIMIEEAYGDISAELANIKLSQKTLDVFTPSKNNRLTVISPKKFSLEKVDRVVINPPFTAIEKLPDSYRKSFTSSTSSEVCGKKIALWGHFMALADRVVTDGGKIGAVIPISMLHGKQTLKIREYYLKNYSIQYIIKPNSNFSFSEDSSFTDIIFVAKKTKPKNNQKVRVVSLKINIDELSTPDIENLAKRITTQLVSEIDDKDYLSYDIAQSELLVNVNNLMPYIFTNNKKVFDSFNMILGQIKTNSKFIRIHENSIRDGHQLRPKGSVEKSVFTYNYSKTRITKSRLVFDNDQNTDLQYHDKEDDKQKTINKSKIEKTFRTITGVDVLDSTKIYDYILIEKSKIKEKSHLIIPNRLRLNSQETFVTGLYFSDALCPLNQFFMYLCSKDDAKILVLYFNSIFYLVQFLMNRKQSTQGYLEIKQIDMRQIYIPNLEELHTKNKEKLFDLFNKQKNRPMGSIISELSEKDNERLYLDKTLADCLGLKINLTELKTLYDLVYEHITME